MIRNVLFTLKTLLFALAMANGQTYVNMNASGQDDGSSWENAYTNLDSALAKTTNGEIWIAAGTYRHNGSAPDSFKTFYVGSDVDLYGGFAGTEVSKDQRDLNNNTTLLTADFNADDIAGRFDTLREDNSYHVMTIDSFIMSPVIIDGLTFSGGNTNNNTNLSQYNRRGGGIYTWSTIEVNNCIFIDNYANAGASIFLDPLKGGGSGSKMTSNVFTKNRATSRGAGTYFFDLKDITIEDNVFTENITARGCIYPFASDNIVIRNNEFTNNTQVFDGSFSVGIFIFESTNITIDSCLFAGNIAASATAVYFESADSIVGDDHLVLTNTTFENNIATTGFGGAAIYSWQGVGMRVENCIFSNCSGGNGAVFYHDGRSQFVDPTNLVFKNCHFLDNTSTDFGGGVGYAYQSSFTIEDCLFDGNTASNGGSLFITSVGNGKEVIIRNSEFRNGDATFGGVCNLYSGSSTFLIENCLFENNNAGTSGGAIITGFRASSIIKNCTFMGNTAKFGGGIYVQNDSTLVEINNSDFILNQATTDGGGINLTDGSVLTVNKSIFNTNAASNGGGISTAEFSDNAFGGKLFIDGSEFYFNSATGQGGGINIIGTDAVISNTVIANNFNLGGISGAGISGNASDSTETTNIMVINSTLADNDGDLGSGIGLFTGERESTLILTIQNTIFANEGENYAIEAGSPEVVSKGGNLSTDTTLNFAFMPELQDKPAVDADIFVEPSEQDFHLADGSPAINIGQVPAPEFDIEGNPRVNAPDAGSYEYQQSVSVEEELPENTNQIKIAPNPVLSAMNLSLDNEWRGRVSARLCSVNGQLVQNWMFDKYADAVNQRFDLSNIAPGSYDLLLSNGEKVITTRLIKIK